MSGSSGLTLPYGEAACRGRIKQIPQDFKVDELLRFALLGTGEHLFLQVQKCGLTTMQMIERIAAQLGVSTRQIGYSGLKDKQAVTRQWVSVQLPGCRETPSIESDDSFQILQIGWHDRKLRIGSHAGNRFEVVVRDFEGDFHSLQQVCERIRQSGFANYFGQQRFGKSGDNVSQALRILSNRHKCKRLSRQKKGLYLSALRSELFNRILSMRLERSIWQAPLEGDLFMLDGSQSIFSEGISETLLKRYQSMDIHSAISLAGSGESRLQGAAQALEEEILSAEESIVQTLLQQKVKRANRASRARAHHLEISLDTQARQLHLSVELDKGVYLTSLLSHFVEFSSDRDR